MRVCILTTSFPRDKNDSSGVFLYHLSKALIAKGVNVEVIAPHDYGSEFNENMDGIYVNRFPYFYPLIAQKLGYGAGILNNIRKSGVAALQVPVFLLAELFFLIKILKKRKIDLIHAHWTIPQGFIGRLAGFLFKVPLITTIHGSDIHGFKRVPAMKFLNKLIIKASDYYTVNSRAMAKMVYEVSGRNDSVLIPMGVDYNFFSRKLKEKRQRKENKAGEKKILFVGRLIELKGVDYLIRAFAKILKQGVNAKLLLAGDGPEKKHLVEVSKNEKISEKVCFLGLISHNLLPELLSSIDLFVLPSIINSRGETEGLGVVLLEAMAGGVPVIGSNVGGIPDIIKDGKTGLLFRQKDSDDLADKMMSILSDEQLSNRLVKEGTAHVQQHYTWDIIADRFIAIYDDILNKKNQ